MAAPSVFGVPLKYVSLVVLTVQNSTLVLVMRYSRVSSSTAYFTSTAVLMSEATKFVVCLWIAARESMADNGGRLEAARVYRDVLGGDSWKMLIPAALYTIQNNLQYVSVSLLDAATFQVTYQLKILTTALCAVALLGTRLDKTRWAALLVLTLGVILVQRPAPGSTGSSSSSSSSSSSRSDTDAQGAARLLGLLAVFCACVLSGLAGVYFEKVLKGSRKSVWTRNVQLSLFSVVPALFGTFAVDGAGIARHGFFYGYTPWTVATIACQAGGGMIVAVVVKYADNILKGFATSISIVLSCLASVWLFDFRITPAFLLGTVLVLYASYAYGKQEAAQHGPAPALPTATSAAADRTDGDKDSDAQTLAVAVDQLPDHEEIPMSGISPSDDAKLK
ncbi:UDP-galactose transporter Gms1 [Coemansia javaensis]|uniref:UDP-galactose transporter Gms1 n=1 Tax=Coemansia javaensis TaxID=2761396 RepID=A0A9W8H5I9_9FUNG|nr:UDP-galactose transporter Gms1 [Coemansia javaensis]